METLFNSPKIIIIIIIKNEKKPTPEEIRGILEASSSTHWNQSKEFPRLGKALVPKAVRCCSAMLAVKQNGELAWLWKEPVFLFIS